MPVAERRPAPPLDAAIASIWAYEDTPGPRRLERVLPNGAAQLIVNLTEDETRCYRTTPSGVVPVRMPGAILSGLATSARIIDTDEQACVVGVTFRPGGTLAFARESAEALTDLDVPLDALWGARATSLLRERLLAAPTVSARLDVLERSLAARWCARAPHPATAYAVRMLRDGPTPSRIGWIADRVALSPRRFAERFARDVGITPKRYCRLLRFQDAVGRAHPGPSLDWAGFALACGYYDQAHFIHEFQAFAGMTPTAYAAGRTAFPNHVTFLQSGAGAACEDGPHG